MLKKQQVTRGERNMFLLSVDSICVRPASDTTDRKKRSTAQGRLCRAILMRPWRGLGMTVTAQDEKYMREALTLAREGTALASPGPRVGAVIVSAKGQRAGRGVYTYNEIEHAEALSLRQAGNAARGWPVRDARRPTYS